MKELSFSLNNIKEAALAKEVEVIIKLPSTPTNKEVNILFAGLAYLTQLKIKFTVIYNHKDVEYVLVINR